MEVAVAKNRHPVMSALLTLGRIFDFVEAKL